MAETAIVTALSTNILNAGTDIATGNVTKVGGLTQHESKVIEAVTESRIAEQEKNGKKLSSKAKEKIRNDVIEQMDKGQLDIDTIESVLGGETYETYKNLTEQENALQSKKKAIESEISSLVKTPESQFTIEQRERLTSLREEARGIKENIKALDTKTAKNTLFNEVNKLTKNDTRLRESYNERARRGQAFEADLTKYKGKQREAVERAINSGVLNNTYRSHELVDTLSKIEADKGITFDYTNNKKLKESGFAIKGKTVNGFVKDGGVTLNVQSSKAWQSTVGHEITHVLEGTEAYSALREALYAYAESKGELASRKADLAELYNGINADIDAELTADLVGDYLFTDKDFINKLTGNRPLFQKVWDEVKYLCKVATGKELTEIEKVEREFAKAWKEQGQTAQSNSDILYSLTDIDKNGDFSYNKNDLYTGSDSFILEVSKNDRNSFARSLANKTADLGKDEIRTVEIYGADKIYFFEATGYMQGKMLKSVSTDDYDGYIKSRKEYENGINRSSETPNTWVNTLSAYRKGERSDISDIGIRRGKNDVDGIYGRASERNSTGTQERSGENFEDDPKEVERVIAELRKEYGYMENHPTNEIAPINETSSTDGVFFDSDIGPTENFSLSNKSEQFAPIGNYSTPLNETALEQDIAPVAKNATTSDDNVAPAEQTVDGL